MVLLAVCLRFARRFEARHLGLQFARSLLAVCLRFARRFEARRFGVAVCSWFSCGLLAVLRIAVLGLRFARSLPEVGTVLETVRLGETVRLQFIRKRYLLQ